MARNANLGAAKRAKNDEFYTRWEDIEAEMNAYVGFNRDVFRDKVVLLPCDDPEWSQFTRYFAANFEWFGLKKLISTSYAKGAGNRRTTDFERGGAAYDAEKHAEHGKVFTLERGEGPVDIDHLTYEYLEGDGDFRSDEVRALRDEADIIVTNPMFSLFRPFLDWILEANKQFIIIGNVNAITYKEVFPLLKDNKVWCGSCPFTGSRWYVTAEQDDDVVPSLYKFAKKDMSLDPQKYGFFELTEKGLWVVPQKTIWYTNIDLAKRHETLQLDTMANNLRFNKKLKRTLEKKYGFRDHYPRYDNYDAIEVPFVECIPSDYDGVMGVPITFLDKYNPEQFEILAITKTWFGAATKTYGRQLQVSASGKTSTVTKLNDGPALKLDGPPMDMTYYVVDGEYYIQGYARILIRPIKH